MGVRGGLRERKERRENSGAGTPVVRAAGFEPAASWSRTTRDAKLRHARGDGPDAGQCHPVRPVPADAASYGGGCRAYGRFPWRLRIAHVRRLSARHAPRIRRRFRALSGGTVPAVVPAGTAYVMTPFFFGVWQAICRAPPAGAAMVETRGVEPLSETGLPRFSTWLGCLTCPCASAHASPWRAGPSVFPGRGPGGSGRPCRFRCF